MDEERNGMIKIDGFCRSGNLNVGIETSNPQLSSFHVFNVMLDGSIVVSSFQPWKKLTVLLTNRYI